MDYQIPKKQLLPFIINQDLYSGVEFVLGVARNAVNNSEKDFYKNVVDPFSALFEVMTTGISSAEWMKKESARQVQKTIQNALGSFHQEILGHFTGWESLGVGNVVDLVNKDAKIIAEVKNKHNTTKGNHKVAIYDDLKKLLSTKYKGYVGYYVEVIPICKLPYSKILSRC
ncbi:MAG: hypothetical protein A2821_00670 [Candidatus Magasanikbacteria bacterium RIFCSPHIGHO2_01_FULL_41_23]|uniref:Restriction endonuclease n=1 Tax=Candidatus Magasanikbacteria bacterium RIFCSPLOWO2_01_FULL_40_15 TaxID=1798686 RepID=A0A1F6N0J1_9BACT|nr:MAG: hypothetical protein A2821_00670 [Candidatus Magasanikbacteria bacterium RIFCSPHIGHO2_01_FULL_41_23]OGH74687.1 MAG: hypothetical protein A3F22_02025 [Candidatus Magasanikbacteria bacterium RIFCSPHIGHO2_12_FULL_41_16]OGH77402.1 MAG: hypothetical protein A2983_01725 [Candidatus Magasanikbacteria bacterium RIFCSPLOWO2_01_FULL_40_15]